MIEEVQQTLIQERIKDATSLREREQIRRQAREHRVAKIRGQIAHLNYQLEAKWQELRDAQQD
jgi:glucose-6-phosphate dehydrogenase assembly protein OpcA